MGTVGQTLVVILIVAVSIVFMWMGEPADKGSTRVKGKSTNALSTGGKFIFGNDRNTMLSPYEYGAGAVEWSKTHAAKLIGIMISWESAVETKPFIDSLRRNSAPSQFETFAVMVAAYVMYSTLALRESKSPADDIREIRWAIEKEILSIYDRSIVGVFHQTWKGYYQVFKDELEEPISDLNLVKPSPSSLASTVLSRMIENQGKIEGNKAALSVDTFGRMYFERQISVSTIDYLVTLKTEMGVRYIP